MVTGPLAMNICADSLDVGPPCPEPFPLRVMGAELRLPPSRLELLGDAFIPLEPVEVMAGRELPFSLMMIILTIGDKCGYREIEEEGSKKGARD